MKYKNEEHRLRDLLWLGDNWETITDTDLAERFGEMSELDKYAFMVSLDDEEQLDFFKKVVRGKDREIEKLMKMTREVIGIARETQEDRSEDLKDWALLSYLRERDVDGDFESKLVKLAVKWFMDNDLYAVEADRKNFMTLAIAHVSRAKAEIERCAGKESAEEFAEKVAGVLA